MKQEVNGASLVKEHVPGMNTIMIGISVPVGASTDPEGCSGMAHLCEHLRAAACNYRLGSDRLRRITLEAFTEREERPSFCCGRCVRTRRCCSIG